MDVDVLASPHFNVSPLQQDELCPNSILSFASYDDAYVYTYNDSIDFLTN